MTYNLQTAVSLFQANGPPNETVLESSLTYYWTRTDKQKELTDAHNIADLLKS